MPLLLHDNESNMVHAVMVWTLGDDVRLRLFGGFFTVDHLRDYETRGYRGEVVQINAQIFEVVFEMRTLEANPPPRRP